MSSAYFKLKAIKRQKHYKGIRKESTRNHSESKKVSDLANHCRVCLEELKGDSVHIYYECVKPNNLIEAIQTFGDIEFISNENFPKKLCSACNLLLSNAVTFRKLAKESDAILRQMIEEPACNNRIFCFTGNSYKDENDESDVEQTQNEFCKVCNSNFCSIKEYMMHTCSKNHKNMRIQCLTCNGLFAVHMYKKHLARHQSASHLVCEVCGKLYRKDNLIRHLQLHSNDLPFQCQMCPYRGRFSESLKIHLRTHSGDRPFSCDKCQMCFLTRSNLNRHLFTHKKERPYKCIECGRGFYAKRDMDAHYKSDHAGIKDFECRICSNKYGTRKALMRHELRVHNRDKMAKGRVPLYLQDEYKKTMN